MKLSSIFKVPWQIALNTVKVELQLCCLQNIIGRKNFNGYLKKRLRKLKHVKKGLPKRPPGKRSRSAALSYNAQTTGKS